MPMIPGELITQDDVNAYPRHRPIKHDTAPTVVLLTGADPHQWAIIQRHVGGWRCIATGTYTPPVAPKTWGSVFAPIIDAYGDGFARLPLDHFGVRTPDASDVHLRRAVGEPDTYCGTSVANPYVHIRGRYMQHCMRCTTTYRAEHHGRVPVESSH